MVDSIDQPDPRRKRECPPEKGFALISMSAWVMPMFIVPVSLAQAAMITSERGRLTGDRETTISSLML